MDDFISTVTLLFPVGQNRKSPTTDFALCCFSQQCALFLYIFLVRQIIICLVSKNEGVSRRTIAGTSCASQNHLLTCKQCLHNIFEERLSVKGACENPYCFSPRKHTSMASRAILSEFPVMLKSRGIGLFSAKLYTTNPTCS